MSRTYIYLVDGLSASVRGQKGKSSWSWWEMHVCWPSLKNLKLTSSISAINKIVESKVWWTRNQEVNEWNLKLTSLQWRKLRLKINIIFQHWVTQDSNNTKYATGNKCIHYRGNISYSSLTNSFVSSTPIPNENLDIYIRTNRWELRNKSVCPLCWS